jgi:putative flavoprotein involved in K+ transport
MLAYLWQGSAMTNHEAAVIGAGWAGVAVSHALRRTDIGHVVYEGKRICETWRTQRWTSFRMNTPNVFTVMPGDRYLGEDPEGFMTCDQFVDMVERYARRHELPIIENTLVCDCCGGPRRILGVVTERQNTL